MKIEKRIDRTKGIDIYLLYINHDEADAAFALMTPLEKGMLRDLRSNSRPSTFLKVLMCWVLRIEESQGIMEEVQEHMKHEG